MTWKNSLASSFLVVLFLGAFFGTAAADTWPGRQDKVLGLSVKTSFPYAELNDDTQTGWGIAGMVDYPLIPLIDLTADVGVNHFPGDGEKEDVDVWNVCFGGRLALGAFFMGGETGFFTHVDEWSFVPSMGLRFNRFEGAVRYKAVGGASWTSIRLGVYF